MAFVCFRDSQVKLFAYLCCVLVIWIRNLKKSERIRVFSPSIHAFLVIVGFLTGDQVLLGEDLSLVQI